jgi:DNA polymerase-4
VKARDDGRVAVRFETAATGPGRQIWLDPATEEVELVGALGPDGAEVPDAADGPDGPDRPTTPGASEGDAA